MARSGMDFVVILLALAVALTVTTNPAQAQLDPFFYVDTCPDVLPIVAEQMVSALQNDSRIGASLVRMHFHDCFVQGCDASILLDLPAADTEKTTPPNNNSIRGYDVIDTIKAAIEEACPGVVSCADVVALGSFFGVVLSGGPIWAIPLGRGDALEPRGSDVLARLAGPFAGSVDLQAKWGFWNLSTDTVTLSGAHTIGDVRCFTMSNPNEAATGQSTNPDLNATRVDFFEQFCGNYTPALLQDASGMDDFPSVPINSAPARVFDNGYFKQFATNDQVFHSDFALLNTSDFAAQVQLYASNQTAFFEDFAASMIKMGNLNTSYAPQLEIRQNCHAVNPTSNNLRMPGQQEAPRTPPRPRRVPRDLTEAEKDKYILEIREIIAQAAYKVMAKYKQSRPVVTDHLYSSS